MRDSSPPITVLAVDDESPFLDVVTTYLGQKLDGVEVLTATSAADGLARLGDAHIDCIVSDYDMPGRNGIEFLEAVRDDYPDLPFILFTGKGSEEIASQAISAGVTDYLQKGGAEQFTLLANRIQNAVEGTRAKVAARQHRDRLDGLTDAFPDVAFFIDENGRYRDVLAGPEEPLPAVETSDLEGITLDEVFPSEQADRLLETVRRALDADQRQTIEYDLECGDGRRWYEAQVTPAAAPQLDCGAVVWVARDITDRKSREQALETARTRMETALEVTDAVVWDADVETEQATFYPSSEILYGTEISTIDGFFAQVHSEDREMVRRAVQNALDTGAPYEAVFRIEQEGEIRWIRDYGEVQFEDGTPVRITGVAQDITAAKEREANLERDRERLAAVFDAVPHPITEVEFEDDVPIVTQVNDEFEETFGYAKATVTGNPLDEFIVPEDRRDEATSLNQLAQDCQTIEREIERVTADGERRSFLFRTAQVSEANDSHWLATYIDITERKERERRLEEQTTQLEAEVKQRKAAETRYRSLFENNPVVIWEEDFSEAKAYVDSLAEEVDDVRAHLDANPDVLEEIYDRIDIVDVNETALDYYDATSKDELLDGIQQLMTEVTHETNKDLWASVAAGETEFRAEIAYETLSGERRHEIMEMYVPDAYADDYSRVYVTAIDITERTQRAQERRALFQNTPLAIAHTEFVDGEPRVKVVNPAFEETFGHAVDEIRGRSIDDVIVPDEKKATATEVNRRVQTGEQVEMEVRRRGADGLREFILRTIPIGSGSPVEQSYAMYQDITARKERERDLERYETFVEASGDPLFTLDADGEIRFVNEAFVEFTGYDRDALIGGRPSIFTTEEGISQGEDVIRSLLQSSSDRATFELDVLTADGTRVPCENHVALLPFEDDFRGTVGILRDITERKQRAEELERQNERLDQFASLVAHDLRNPLNVARGQLDLARQEVENEHLDAVARAHQRTETLIEDLLTLARSGNTVKELQHVDLSTLGEACWETVETGEATLVTETSQTVLADRNRLRQLLENLLRNAIDHGGGDVTVTLGDLDGGFYVADDGPGIPADERAQVFESGYSTSEDGYGFGLAITREIVNAHGWDVAITESDAGGARFEITGVDVPANTADDDW